MSIQQQNSTSKSDFFYRKGYILNDVTARKKKKTLQGNSFANEEWEEVKILGEKKKEGEGDNMKEESKKTAKEAGSAKRHGQTTLNRPFCQKDKN